MNYEVLAHKALYMLRSYPELFGLRADERGWCSLSEFLGAMRINYQELHVLRKNYLGVCTKGMVEVKHGRIRVQTEEKG